MTDRQIFELYFHPRDQHGAIDAAAPPAPAAHPDVREVRPRRSDGAPTLEDELANVDTLASLLHLPPAQADKLKDDVRAKFRTSASV